MSQIAIYGIGLIIQNIPSCTLSQSHPGKAQTAEHGMIVSFVFDKRFVCFTTFQTVKRVNYYLNMRKIHKTAMIIVQQQPTTTNFFSGIFDVSRLMFDLVT